MKCNIEIIDNYLSEELYNDIKFTLTESDFPWYLQKNHKVGKLLTPLEDSRIDFQFIHGFYRDFCFQSHYYKLLIPIIDQLKPSALIRIKANLTTYANKVMPFHYHIDNEEHVKCKTAIYYVNTTNGPTIFETGEEIECIGNRMIIFNSTIKHTGTTHTNEKFRCVLNFNYYN